MEYTVGKLAKISGVSPRTLRYYNEVGLLNPKELNASGYRIYGDDEVKRLQQILFYKALDVPLEDISLILDTSGFNPLTALENHKKSLLVKQMQIETLVNNVEQSINELKGGRKMSDIEKFEGFKEKMIQENEAKYGEEVREKYGNDVINSSNEKIRKMSQQGQDKAAKLGIIIMEKLNQGFEAKDYKGELAQEIYELHKDWIMCYWSSYSPEGHKGLSDMYVSDKRFKEYYDKEQEGLSEYLRQVIHNFAQ